MVPHSSVFLFISLALPSYPWHPSHPYLSVVPPPSLRAPLTTPIACAILTTVVVNNIQEALRDIGFSEYEARAYVSALTLKSASAYEIARDARIPTSKVYETIKRLQEKELLFEAARNGKKKYVPLSGEEFIARARSLSDKRFESLARDLRELPAAGDVSIIWNIDQYEALVEKSVRLVREAETTLLLSLWPEELERIGDDLAAAEKRGVRVACIYFGSKIARKVGTIFPHPIEDTLYAERGGRGFTLVADSRAAVMGTMFEKGGVEGAWSVNRGFVLLAEDYLKHDIYIMKIVNRFDRELIDRFGKNYAMLRDVYRDGERGGTGRSASDDNARFFPGTRKLRAGGSKKTGVRGSVKK